MSSSSLTPTERLMNDIEIAYEAHQEDRVETEPLLQTPEWLAEQGKPAVTSLYAESFLAVDELPKNSMLRWARSKFGKGGVTSLTEGGSFRLMLADQSVELNPLYEQGKYQGAKKRFDPYPNKKSPSSALTNTNREDQDNFAELGLAALHNAVLFGFSRYLHHARQWHWMVPKRILQTMVMNGSLDKELTQTLAEVRRSKRYEPAEYIQSLLQIAADTTNAITQPSQAIQEAASEAYTAPISTREGRRAFSAASCLLAACLGEAGHMLVAGNQKIAFSAVVLSGMTGLAGGDKLACWRGKQLEARAAASHSQKPLPSATVPLEGSGQAPNVRPTR